ncbi:YbaK/EbsC family protein [Motilimonas cestriensis]|uniref:YbaK/EbsC family protein n=1 Tax=Motilimonas cestriensis TaxID=2742685 RepID=A0ABS8W4Q6_9GAMM|nr:YbaK/EbsC family protein [Motilimonas cestriensis]MCE2593949.1 YbaK/EbsC family protein [Motilimonas cestriensis]
MYIQRLSNYLNQAHINYQVLQHSPAYKAKEIAEMTHISGMDFAKTLIINVDGISMMLVLPGTYRWDPVSFANMMGAQTVELVPEEELALLFPNCEVGAMPPFGNLYGIAVYIARELTLRQHIMFNAGNHHEVWQMDYYDYHELVAPRVITEGYLRKNPSRPVHVHHGGFSH